MTGLLAVCVIGMLVLLLAALFVLGFALVSLSGTVRRCSENASDGNEQCVGAMLGMMEKEYTSLKPDNKGPVKEWDHRVDVIDRGTEVGPMVGQPSVAGGYDDD